MSSAATETPGRSPVIGGAVGNVDQIGTVGIHDVDFRWADLLARFGSEGYLASIWGPGGVHIPADIRVS